MTIAIGQMRVYSGMPQKNKETMLGMIAQAKEQGVDTIFFPELAIPGVLCGDYMGISSFLDECELAGNEIAEAAQGIQVVFGNYYFDEEQDVLQNRVFYGSNGKLYLLPAALGREWIPGAYVDFPNETDADSCKMVIDGDSYRVGFLLGNWSKMEYHFDLKKLDLLVDLSARPCILDEAFDLDLPKCAYLSVNCYGLQNCGKANYIFSGGSFYQNQAGKISLRGEAFTEGLYIWDLKGKKTSVAPALSEDDKLKQALVHGVRCFCDEKRIQNAVIGISGGIDSALAACVYTKALGADHVYLVSMPTHFNSKITKSLAKRMADGLGTFYAEIPIEQGYEDMVAMCQQTVFENSRGEQSKLVLSALAKENVMARERGRVLMTLSAAVNGIFTCNGNKTEAAAGYATFYGDLAGAFACQADLWKYQVYQASAAFQKDFPLAPLSEISAIRPSAELSEAQSVDAGLGDPLIYPYHDYLFRWWVEAGGDVSEILDFYENGVLEELIGCKKGILQEIFPDAKAFIADLEYWWKQYRGISVAKRIQAPPFLVLSGMPFGAMFEQSQTGTFFSSEYLDRKAEILGHE